MITFGLRAQKGGAVAVAVDPDGPRVVLSTILPIAAESDRQAREPYAVAREMVLTGHAVSEAAAVVAEGRRRQDEAAADGLRRLAPERAALLINRAGWITDLIGYCLEWAEHVPVAEGLAVRDALRAGCEACGINVVEVDEKSLMERAQGLLGLGAEEIENRLKAMGARLKPWRKEQKLATLAAWLVAAEA